MIPSCREDTEILGKEVTRPRSRRSQVTERMSSGDSLYLNPGFPSPKVKSPSLSPFPCYPGDEGWDGRKKEISPQSQCYS